MSIIHRDAVLEDAAVLAGLFRAVFLETFGHLYESADVAQFFAAHDEEKWARQLRDPAFAIRVADARAGLIGYSKLGPVRLPVDPDGPALELRQLYVSAGWRGRGVAPTLMSWTVDEARNRGASSLYLSVYTENHRARRFYRRYGFEEVGPYTFMVGSQADDDIILRCNL